MQSQLRQVVEAKLADADVAPEAALMVLAALEGRDDLASLLKSAVDPEERDASASASGDKLDVAAPSAYLKQLAVQGFRGIGPRSVLELETGPGLTLVVGRNGSGKSSFAEGLETLLTGENRRWSGRTAIWREGWRNLHQGDDVLIEATFHVEGHAGPTTVTRTWGPDEGLLDGEAWAQHHGLPRESIDALGWGGALATYRPFLSYNELGSMLNEGPAKLYDALSAILGLEDLVDAQETLRQARLERSRKTKNLHDERDTSLIPELEESDDARARSALEALNADPMRLDLLEAALGTAETGRNATRKVEALARLMAIEALDLEMVGEISSDLRAAGEALARTEGTDSALARDTLGLLNGALALHQQHSVAPCPVCEASRLDADWVERVQGRIEALEQAAREADAAHNAAAAASERVRSVLQPAPSALNAASQAGIDCGPAAEAWRRLIENAPTKLDALATHLEEAALELEVRVQRLVAAAREEHARVEDAWRPTATRIAAFVETARPVLLGESQVGDLKRAEDWLKGALADIRNERFAPISEQSTAIWEKFGSQSNVQLAHLELAGSHGKRRVVLDVQVDGVDGAALGVMSQGELHALALSLFLRRATLPESPFGMVVVDDPVQAMDPARVDGLAHVLDDIAKVRQVIVFTHDDRLPESIRRLGIDAHVVEVTRREGSRVELRPALDPVSRYLDDARALANTAELPTEVGQRVVPGFCRLALEAACCEVARRRRIGRGEPHSAVEEELDRARKLSQRMALALFDDSGRGGDVLRRLNQMGAEAADVYQCCNRGAHEPVAGVELGALIRDAEKLVGQLRGLQ